MKYVQQFLKLDLSKLNIYIHFKFVSIRNLQASKTAYHAQYKKVKLVELWNICPYIDNISRF